MGWKIIDNRIAYVDGEDILFPSSSDIYNLIQGEDVDNNTLRRCISPAEVLNIRFSRISAKIRILIQFDKVEGDILLRLIAVKGTKCVDLVFESGLIPDSVVIDNTWYSLLAAQNIIIPLMEKAKIFENGIIKLNQYAAIKRECLLSDEYDLVDEAEQFLDNHSGKSGYDKNPAALKAVLYPYQEQGFHWMKFIADQKCGCILGDEMGLGKTLQVIALLTERKQIGSGPALVVAPVSLLENWRREFEKFTNNMKVFVHHGSHRTGIYTELLQYDVVVISYNTAVTDLSMLKMVRWDSLIIDEAQNIKNPTAIRTKAIKEIPRTVAIAVTGTPFENHLSDVWSIMDFVMPEYLGKLSDFEKEFPDDIEGAEKVEPLVTPFMVRRRVGEVAKDLPERIDIPQILSLSDAETIMYEDVREQILAEYDGKKATLPMLQKLRMFCTHPSLISSNLSADPIMASEKYNRLCELLEEIVALKEKVILFTSYNGMFDIFAKDIPSRFGIPVMAINGATPTEERQPIIDTFSSIEGSALLVLNPRAAGAGLNITAASRVIHYNLEWNPALEDQASARAYRRGQTKTVFVYRLYYKDTVEEIINDRIDKKREMFGAAVIGVDGEKANSDDILRALMISLEESQMSRPTAITKILSSNDTGETGGHQAGILVPKNSEVLSFFPDLGCEEKNPRVVMYFVDESGKSWKLNFIYYNNKFFDQKGTRNEYRLTGMTAYFRENALKAGDAIILTHLEDGTDTIRYQRTNAPEVKIVKDEKGNTKKKLVLSTSWRVIDCE